MSSILSRLRAAGIDITLDGEDLDVQPRTPLTEAQVGFLRAHKAEIVAELRADVPRCIYCDAPREPPRWDVLFCAKCRQNLRRGTSHEEAA